MRGNLMNGNAGTHNSNIFKNLQNLDKKVCIYIQLVKQNLENISLCAIF